MAMVEKKNLNLMTRDQLQDYANTLEDRLEASYKRNVKYIEKYQACANQRDGLEATMEAKVKELEATVAAQQSKIKRLTRKPRTNTVAKAQIEPQPPHGTLVSTVAETHML
jgi:hypothetical protein